MVDSLLGKSQQMQALRALIQRVAPTESKVLILGETGTGKELVAKAVHRCSKRADKSFIAVNCASIPENLVESELFGYEKGAFTGAVSARAGRFEQANDGTLFLDEVGELPLSMQAKLLRVLQSGDFERVGHGATRKANVRIIAATNRDLEVEVQDGRFRQDLLHRLKVFTLVTAPLRERLEDIEETALSFLKHHKGPEASISPGALIALQAHSWPGNVRELGNIIERAALFMEELTLECGDVRSAFDLDRSFSVGPRRSSEPTAPPAVLPSQSPSHRATTTVLSLLRDAIGELNSCLSTDLDAIFGPHPASVSRPARETTPPVDVSNFATSAPLEPATSAPPESAIPAPSEPILNAPTLVQSPAVAVGSRVLYSLTGEEGVVEEIDQDALVLLIPTGYVACSLAEVTAA